MQVYTRNASTMHAHTSQDAVQLNLTCHPILHKLIARVRYVALYIEEDSRKVLSKKPEQVMRTWSCALGETHSISVITQGGPR